MGELVDRMTILELKSRRLPETSRTLALRELAVARALRARANIESERVDDLTAQLEALNAALWDAEEALRDCELRQAFGGDFVALARSVYRLNDRRAALKRAIDEAVDGDSGELKSHPLPAV